MLFGSYGSDGSFRWSMRMGGPYAETSCALERVASGGYVLIGETQGDLDYGPGVFEADGANLFVLRLASD
jgi:hypothetical protein